VYGPHPPDIEGLTVSACRAFDILHGNYKRTKIATMFGDSPLTNTAVAAHQHSFSYKMYTMYLYASYASLSACPFVIRFSCVGECFSMGGTGWRWVGVFMCKFL